MQLPWEPEESQKAFLEKSCVGGLGGICSAGPDWTEMFSFLLLGSLSNDMPVSSRCDCYDSSDDLPGHCLGNCHHRSDFKDAEGKTTEAK